MHLCFCIGKNPILYFSMRQDVFDVVVAFNEKGLDGLSAEEKRYVERLIKYGRRNGRDSEF